MSTDVHVASGFFRTMSPAGNCAGDTLPATGYAEAMRLAAIDIGSNSLHMIIADVTRDGHIEVVDRVKETVRLGHRSFTTGSLTDEAMDMTVRTLDYFSRLARLRGVSRMRAVATSAVREARNRDPFIARIKRETDIEVQVISGDDEAKLIFTAAQHALGLDGGPHLLLDIGGGSAELVLVKDTKPLWMKSAKLGAARLSERFLPDDPPTTSQRKHLIKHLEDEIGDQLRSARREGVVRVIGTSGTVNTLIAMARAARGEELGRLHGAAASPEEVETITEQLVERSAAARADMPGMDAKRIDLMPAAALLVDFVMRRSDAPQLIACTWALREGVLLELVGNAGRRCAADARRRSVEGLASRFLADNEHGRHVAHLALELFDATASALGLSPGRRQMLEYAALLHDIGHVIDHDRHNRHSYYLIKNAELLGFNSTEIEMLALIARGHRKQGGQFYSNELRGMSAEEKRTVRGLAALLRVADALDRSHFGVVRDILPTLTPGRLTLTIDSGVDAADLEQWTCERRTDLLARMLDRRVVLQR